MLEHIDTIIDRPGLTTRPTIRRFGFLQLILIICLGLLAGRGFYLQVWQGSRWRAMAEGNRMAVTAVTAPRGIIYDKMGHQLVENVASTDLVLDPSLLPTVEHESTLLERLPKYIHISSSDLAAIISQAKAKQQVTIIAKALDHDQVLALEQAQGELPGIRLTSSLVRKYPLEKVFAHVLGYTSPITAEELQQSPDLLPTDITGKTGLEKTYDRLLHGQNGNSYLEVNAAGQAQKEVDYRDPVPGANLTLGIDSEFQKYVYQVLSDRNQQTEDKEHTPSSGAVIAIDPRSGVIRALVSYPSFDPNVFSQPSLRQNAADLFKDPQQPLFNRVSDGAYAPGSTIKPILASAALQEGIITPDTIIMSTGGITVGPWHFPDWKAGGHGPTDVTKAIAESVNTFFYLITGGDDTHPGLGVTRATKYLAQFGWGDRTGIDLPGEAKGFLPSPDWKEKTKHEQWYIGDTYHLGIGQGDVLASPLQITAAIAAIADNGQWHQPHLVESIQVPNKKPSAPTVASHFVGVDPVHLQTVQAGMRRTVTDGSGRALKDLAIPIAGKTGTAQIGGTDQTHAWFTSYGPFDQPELVVTVLLEKGGAGDQDSVPLAKNIWEWWISHR